MLDIAVLPEGDWPADVDWEALATRAAEAAFARTPYAGWSTDPAVIELSLIHI